MGGCVAAFTHPDPHADETTAVAQLLVTIGWAAALCYESGQQDPSRASDGGRQLQSSWRAMERLELWCAHGTIAIGSL